MNNEEKTIPMWKLKLQCKAKLAKEKVKEAGSKACKVMIEHPVEAASIVTGVFGIAKLGIKEKRRRDEKRVIDCRVYDRRSDTYSWAKRPLKPAEKLEMERRYRNGELKSEVLKDLGILKY